MEITKRVEQESIRQIAVREQMSVLTSWLGYGLQGAVLWSRHPSAWVIGWMAALACLEGLNGMVAHQVLRADSAGMRLKWHARLPFTLACAGSLWGCLIFLPGAASGLEQIFFNLLVLAVVAIISVHNLCLYPRALLAFSCGLGVPVAMYFVGGDGQSNMIAVAALMLCLLVQIYGRLTRKLIVYGTTARFTQEVTAQQLERRNGELATALETIRELANTDSLTRCLNRRAGLACMEAEQVRAQRQQLPFGVIMVDVDFFKRVNDVHGHAAGDAVLIELADTLRCALRSHVDSVIRWGGEEFLCVLSASDEAGLRTCAETLRVAIAARPMGGPELQLAITASLGVAAFRTGDSVAQLVDRADQALYRAKRDGRNQVA